MSLPCLPYTPLRYACQGSARACGFPDSGTIAPGFSADLILIDQNAPHFRPRHSYPANVILGTGPGDVTHVMAAGRWLMRDGELTTLDEERILFEAERGATAMVSKNLELLRRYDG